METKHTPGPWITLIPELTDMLQCVIEYGGEVLARHIEALGDTERNKPYGDTIRADIEKARSLLAKLEEREND